jgi:hypothetical protein
LPDGTYIIMINEIPLVSVNVSLDKVLVNDTVDRLTLLNIKGEEAVNPANGSECAWIPQEFAEIGPALAHALDQAGEPFASLERSLDSAAWVSARLAEVLPLPMVHKQHCLELDDPLERLRYLRPLFEITG